MFISVLCWAEEWPIAYCPEFDAVDRIRLCRICADQWELYAFILQMHVCLAGQDECVGLAAVRLLTNKDFANALEQKMQCNRADKIGM